MGDNDGDNEQHVAQHRAQDVGRIVRLVIAAALVAALVIVAFDNRDDVRVGYAVGSTNAPIWIVLVAAAVIGAFVAWLMRHRPRHRT